MTCTCTMAQKLVGDGCYKCNPEIHIDHLNDELAEVRQQRDELLEALKDLVGARDRAGVLGELDDTLYSILDEETYKKVQHEIGRAKLEASNVIAKVEAEK